MSFHLVSTWFTIANNSADTSIGKTNFSVTCNNHKGYDVALGTEALTGTTVSTNTIPYASADTTTASHAATPTAGTSSWAVKLDGASGYWINNGATFESQTAPKSEQPFSVIYGVATDKTQAADTYKGDAEYTLTPKS